MRDMLAELAVPPALVFPDWDAVEDGSRPFRVHCDASIDGFGATLKQEQPDGSVRSIAYVSGATLDSGRHWTPLDLEASSILWAISSAFEATSEARSFAFSRSTRLWKISKKLGTITRESRGGSSTSPRLTTHSSTEKTTQMVMLTSSRGCHSRRLSTTAAVPAASPLSTMRPYTSSGLAACSPPPPRSPATTWVGWCPNPIAPFWVGSPLLPLIFAIFAHGPRMRIDKLSAPTRRFVACVSAFVGTGDDRLGRAPFWPAADVTFTPVFAVPSGARSVRITPAGPYTLIGDFSGTGAYGPHLHLDAPKNSRLRSVPRKPAVDYGFGPGRVPRPSPSRVDPPPAVPHSRLPLTSVPTTSRTPTPVPTVPIPSDRDRAEPLGTPILGLSTPSEPPSAPTADLNALGAADELHFGDSAARYSHADWEREKGEEPTCHPAIQYTILGWLLALPTEVLARFPSHQRPPFSESQEFAGKGRLHTTDKDIVLRLDRNPTPAYYSLRPAERAACLWGANQSIFTCHYSCAPLNHASLPFDCFLPSRHGTHTSHA